MSFGAPMIWTLPEAGTHDPSDCYACANFIFGPSKKKYEKYSYKEVPSAKLPRPHCPDLPFKFPSPPAGSSVSIAFSSPSSADTRTETAVGQMTDPLFTPGRSLPTKASPLTQPQLDLIIAKLALPKGDSEMLASYLGMYGLLAAGTKITGYRNRQTVFQSFYTVNHEKNYAFCDNIFGLMIAMDIE